jgi:hypothetical protein
VSKTAVWANARTKKRECNYSNPDLRIVAGTSVCFFSQKPLADESIRRIGLSPLVVFSAVSVQRYAN